MGVGPRSSQANKKSVLTDLFKYTILFLSVKSKVSYPDSIQDPLVVKSFFPHSYIAVVLSHILHILDKENSDAQFLASE